MLRASVQGAEAVVGTIEIRFVNMLPPVVIKNDDKIVCCTEN